MIVNLGKGERVEIYKTDHLPKRKVHAAPREGTISREAARDAVRKVVNDRKERGSENE